MASRKAFDPEEGYYLTHANGQVDHYFLDSFVDPWQAKKEVILIQHGFGRNGAFWYHWVPYLARDYVVIRRDLRGHGKSSSPKRLSAWTDTDNNTYENDYPYDEKTIVDEIIEFLDILKVDKVHFLGESTSGMLGEIIAARYPDRVKSLTICSSPLYLPPAALKVFAIGYPSFPEACLAVGSRGWAEGMVKNPGTVPIEMGPEYVKWWVDTVAISDGEGLAGYARFLETVNSTPYLEQIKSPMLILAPTKSVAVPMSTSEHVASKVKNAKIAVIDGPAHEIYVERPKECLSAFRDFLSSLGN